MRGRRYSSDPLLMTVVAMRRVRRRRRPPTTFIPRGGNLEKRIRALMQASAVPSTANILSRASTARNYQCEPLTTNFKKKKNNNASHVVIPMMNAANASVVVAPTKTPKRNRHLFRLQSPTTTATTTTTTIVNTPSTVAATPSSLSVLATPSSSASRMNTNTTTGFSLINRTPESNGRYMQQRRTYHHHHHNTGQKKKQFNRDMSIATSPINFDRTVALPDCERTKREREWKRECDHHIEETPSSLLHDDARVNHANLFASPVVASRSSSRTHAALSLPSPETLTPTSLVPRRRWFSCFGKAGSMDNDDDAIDDGAGKQHQQQDKNNRDGRAVKRRKTSSYGIGGGGGGGSHRKIRNDGGGRGGGGGGQMVKEFNDHHVLENSCATNSCHGLEMLLVASQSTSLSEDVVNASSSAKLSQDK